MSNITEEKETTIHVLCTCTTFFIMYVIIMNSINQSIIRYLLHHEPSSLNLHWLVINSTVTFKFKTFFWNLCVHVGYLRNDISTWGSEVRKYKSVQSGKLTYCVWFFPIRLLGWHWWIMNMCLQRSGCRLQIIKLCWVVVHLESWKYKVRKI